MNQESKDFCEKMEIKIYELIWGEKNRDAMKNVGQVNMALREALVRKSMEICHETGDENTWAEFCAETIEDFLDYENL